MAENIFEIALRCKFRFPFRGIVSTEELYDLSKEQLDSIFKTLNSQVKTANEESLLDTRSMEDKKLSVQIEIVKHVFNVKLAEENARLQARERREKKQRLMEILASKQDETLHGKTEDELKKMIDELE
jgi:hypothetical protein